MNHEKKIEAATEHLILFHPFFAYIALQMPIIPDESIFPKMQTNGVSIAYKPSYVESATIVDIEMVLAHEVAHIILLHPLRLQDKDFDTYNEAADYAINLLLQDSGFPVNSTNMLLDYKYLGQSAEEIYKQIFEEKQEEENEEQNEENEDNNDDGSDGGEGQPENQDGNEEDGEPDEESGEDADGDGGEETNETENNGGEADFDEEAPQNEGWVVPPPKEISESELEDKIVQMAVEAAQQAEMAGEMPGGLKAAIDALKEPKQDWRDILRLFAAEVSANDYNWEIPDQQALQRDIYIPSLNDLSVGGIIFAIDTSISVNDELLKEFLSELRDAASLFTDDVTVIHCDTAVRHVEEVAEEDIESIEPIGRGGTRFSPVFNYIEQEDLNPKALVYFTDGKCHESLTEPEYPVLWCIYENKNFTPEFGEVIIVD